MRLVLLAVSACIGWACAPAAKADPAPAAAPSTLIAKLPEGMVKTVLERVTPQQLAAIEAASRYEVDLVERGASGALPEESSPLIEKLVGTRLALLVAASAFEDNQQSLAAYGATSSSELREQAMAPEVARTKVGRRFLSLDGLKAIHDLLSGSQLIVKPLKPCGAGAIADSFRLQTCVYRENYKSVVGIAWPENGRLEISCSGQLIAPRFVLTADHCFDNRSSDPIVLTHFTNGNSQAVQKGGMTTIAGLSEHVVARVHRGTTAAVAGGLRAYDVAVLELVDQAPFGGFPLFASAFPNPPKMTAAGWGRTDAKLVGQVALEVTSISVRGAHNVQGIDPSFRVWPAALKDGGSICAGDSGGPIFAGLPANNLSSMQLVGLVAAGNDNCTSGNQVITDLTRPETVNFVCRLVGELSHCRR